MKKYNDVFFYKRKKQTEISSEILWKILLSYLEKSKASSVIDFGCGTGIWLAVAKKLGIKTVLGIDGKWVNQNMLEINRDEFQIHNLSVEKYLLKKKFDIALCIEVVEHLPEQMGRELVKTLTEASEIIVFSAAIKNQGGTGHINEQPQHYWVREFKKYGYCCTDFIRPNIWKDNRVNVIYKQNMLVYIKKTKCQDLHLESNVISDSFETDRVHPDLFSMRINSRLDFITKAIEYIARCLKI